MAQQRGGRARGPRAWPDDRNVLRTRRASKAQPRIERPSTAPIKPTASLRAVERTLMTPPGPSETETASASRAPPPSKSMQRWRRPHACEGPRGATGAPSYDIPAVLVRRVDRGASRISTAALSELPSTSRPAERLSSHDRALGQAQSSRGPAAWRACARPRAWPDDRNVLRTRRALEGAAADRAPEHRAHQADRISACRRGNAHDPPGPSETETASASRAPPPARSMQRWRRPHACEGPRGRPAHRAMTFLRYLFAGSIAARAE